MPGPVIAVKFRAGQAEFFEDLIKIKVGVRQFGTEMKSAGEAGVSGMQATSGALRVLEGGLTNNLRAAERFASSVLGLGPLLQAAFPVVGGLAFIGLLSHMGEEVVKFYTTLRDGPEKARGAFDDLNSTLRLSNDELDLSNAKLENEIAKLEGKHENTLKAALDEAKVSADKLNEALDRGLQKLIQLLEQNKTGIVEQLFGSISDKGLREELGGKTGLGGFLGQIRGITDQGVAAISSAKNEQDADQARRDMDAKLKDAYASMIEQLGHELSNTKLAQQASGSFSIAKYSKLIEELTGAKQALAEQLAAIPKQEDSLHLDQRATTDRASNLNTERDQRFAQAMAELDKKVATSNAEVDKNMLRGAIRERNPAEDDIKKFETVTSKDLFGGMWNGEQIARSHLATQELAQQITLQERLAEAAGNFQATHQAQLDSEIARMRQSGHYTEAQIEQYTRLDALKLKAASSERVANLDQGISAIRGRSSAAFGGQDAIRLADLESKIAEARAKGATDAEVTAMRMEDQAKRAEEILLAAGKLATTDSDRLETLGLEIVALQKAHDLNKSDLQIVAALKDLEDQRLKIASQMELQQDSAKAGMLAFFLDMQEQAEKTSQIVYDSLNSAVDKTSENLAKLLTGQGKKGDWGKEFRDLGTKMVESTIKVEIQKSLGELGKKMGIHPPAGIKKPLGTPTDPFYVNVMNAAGGGGEASSPGDLSTLPPMASTPGSPGWGNGGILGTGQVPKVSFGQTLMHGLLGLFTGGAGGGGGNSGDGTATSSITYGGGMAAGGPVEPGSAYLISDSKDDEYFLPKSRGSIVPASKMGGNGDVQITNNIDARGSDLGAGNRVARALDASRKQATADAVRASHERSKRVPGK